MVAALAASGVFGADLANWKNLDALKAGDRVGVIQGNQKRLEGRFEAVTDAGITVDSKTIAKDRVVRIYRPDGMNRGTRALIGAAVGAAVGVVITQTAGRRFANEGAKFGGIPDGLSAAGIQLREMPGVC